jgi:hypothetical protein
MMTICGKVVPADGNSGRLSAAALERAGPCRADQGSGEYSGVRSNQLIGYGIVVGLDNTGDQTTQTPFTTQAMSNMLSQLGINLTQEQSQKLQLKNVAAVMVTASCQHSPSPDSRSM